MKKKANFKTLTKDKLTLQLFVSGMSPKSMEAIENLKRFCDKHLRDAFLLHIIDIYKHPDEAAKHHIIFSPSLIKQKPLPRRTLIGTLEDSEKVIKALGITVN